MHSYHGGLGGKHILPEIQAHITELGRHASKMVDDRYVFLDTIYWHCLNSLIFRMDSFPRWRGLNHFSKVMSVSFADASKLEDITKVCALSSVRVSVYSRKRLLAHDICRPQCTRTIKKS